MIPAFDSVTPPETLRLFWRDSEMENSRCWPAPGGELPDDDHFIPIHIGGGCSGYEIRLWLLASSTSGLIEGKRLVAVVQHSNDGVTWTDLECSVDDVIQGESLEGIVAISITGPDSSLVSLVVRVPSNCQRMIRLCTRAAPGVSSDLAYTHPGICGAALWVFIRPSPQT